MKWFYNMKIGKKLILSFILIAILSAVVGIVGIVQMISIDINYNELYESYGKSMGYLAKVTEGYQMRRGLLKDLIIQSDPEVEQGIVENIRAVDETVNQNMDSYAATIVDEEAQDIFDELTKLFEEYTPLKEGFISYALEGEDEQALGMMSGAGSDVTKNVEASIQNIIQYNKDKGAELAVTYRASMNTSIQLMVGVILFGMALAILLGSFISRIIGKPIRALVIEANKIADGDLNVAINVSTNDEVGQLGKAFEIMSDNLNNIMSNINEAAIQVASGSKQLSNSSQILSQGATEQASSIEELTASMEEVAEQTNQNAKNANQANMLVEKAKANALQGNEQMKEMLGAMDEINSSSANISKIIKVIDDIAFQTNILALNAAVEAARAGQHGKGFAVVAEEVRNLAARSANAAKETTDMIESSIKKVEGGTKTANQTADALRMIVDGISKVADLVGNIALASDEQSKGITQINQGIMQVSAVVQTNSATSEESAAASEELASQADLLNDQVSRFKLRRDKITSTTVKEMRSKETVGNEVISQDVIEMLNNKPRQIKLSDKEFGKY
jgi:methyl-accepting chemotaxis protein